MIDAKWVYTLKVDEHGWVVKVKSRSVTRSFKQREGVDFSETSAPTVSSSYVRLLSAIACKLGLDLCHFDADHKLLFHLTSMRMFFCVCRTFAANCLIKSFGLNKRLYGLKQASRTMACSPNDVSQKTWI